MSKCIQKGQYLYYSDGGLGLYFNKEASYYRIGLDNFYSEKLQLHELKELSNFLVEYVKEQENLK